MTPLQKIAMGLVLVLVDVYPFGFDAVPDVLGWGLAGYGVVGLRGRLPTIGPLMTAVVLSGLVSLALLRPAWTASLPESTGWLLSLPQLAFSVLVCREVAHLAAARAHDVTQRFRILRVVFLVLAVAPVVVYGGGVDALLVPLAVVTVASNVYLVYLLFRIARHPYVTAGLVDEPG